MKDDSLRPFMGVRSLFSVLRFGVLNLGLPILFALCLSSVIAYFKQLISAIYSEILSSVFNDLRLPALSAFFS